MLWLGMSSVESVDIVFDRDPETPPNTPVTPHCNWEGAWRNQSHHRHRRRVSYKWPITNCESSQPQSSSEYATALGQQFLSPRYHLHPHDHHHHEFRGSTSSLDCLEHQEDNCQSIIDHQSIKLSENIYLSIDPTSDCPLSPSPSCYSLSPLSTSSYSLSPFTSSCSSLDEVSLCDYEADINGSSTSPRSSPIGKKEKRKHKHKKSLPFDNEEDELDYQNRLRLATGNMLGPGTDNGNRLLSNSLFLLLSHCALKILFIYEYIFIYLFFVVFVYIDIKRFVLKIVIKHS